MKKKPYSIFSQDQRTLEAWHILWCDVETSNVFNGRGTMQTQVLNVLGMTLNVAK